MSRSKIAYGPHKLARVPERFAPLPECYEIDGKQVSAEFRKTLDEHFSHYCKTNPEHECVKCGTRNSFTWGYTHGHGSCSKCGWPATAYHFVKDETGTEHRIVTVLDVHPDDVVTRRSKRSA